MTTYIIPDEELDDGPNAPLIHFSVYTYQLRYAKYGILTNGPPLCKLCEKYDDIKNGIIKKRTYVKNTHLTKISCYIDEFYMVHYQPMLKKYAYHWVLMCLFSKPEHKELISQAFFNDIKLDYTQAFKAEFDMEIQSQAFGFITTLSIEGSSCEYNDKDWNDRINEVNVNMDFHPQFSDESNQNTVTMCELIKKSIYCIYADNLVKNDGIIYDTIDGCIK